jgi:LysM repeat protein
VANDADVVAGPVVELAGVGSAAPMGPVEPVEVAVPRDVIVRRGESLMHYVKWSKTPLDVIKAANQGRIDGDRIFIGARLTIPMSEASFVGFVTARAEWDQERVLAQANADKGGGDKPAKPSAAQKSSPKTKKYTVKSGETATSIAHKNRLTVKELREVNPGVNLSRLRIGQKLAIPARSK